MHGILYEYPRAERFFLHYPLPALYRSKSYSDYHRTAGSRHAFQHHAAESSFLNLHTKTSRKTHYPLFSGGILMNTYKLVVQTIQNGKITGNASLSVSANSTMEARQKFMASHPPTATKRYKVVACAKQ